MSKWIKKDAFNKFREEVKEEKERPKGNFTRRSEICWATPEKGTATEAKEYVGRFLPDPKGNFYKKYSYHMFRSGDNWWFNLCPKTHSWDNYCPWCQITSHLWTGTEVDKQLARNYKRKEKFVSNFFIVKDPRDESKDKEDKVSGTVKLYEFPNKVEQKLQNEITDSEEGLGSQIFDPGENGHNFLIKVLSTKPEGSSGQTWPDYSTSIFSRKSSPLADSDKEIEAIMEKTLDLDEYINSLAKSDDEVIKIIKDEQFWDLVQKHVEKHMKLKDAKDTKTKTETDDEDIDDEKLFDDFQKEKEDEPEIDSGSSDSDDDSDDDAALIEELKNL